MENYEREIPVGCRSCGGGFPDCSEKCPAMRAEEGNERTWYFFKANTPELLNICVRMLRAEGINFDIVTLHESDEPVYRIYPQTDAETYQKLFERYKRLGNELIVCNSRSADGGMTDAQFKAFLLEQLKKWQNIYAMAESVSASEIQAEADKQVALFTTAINF